jgi:hypothetical protein
MNGGYITQTIATVGKNDTRETDTVIGDPRFRAISNGDFLFKGVKEKIINPSTQDPKA